ncbi:ABC transporter ATP-binding protein [Halocatena halophila]|uniref:ABC transporter ATP-binding protein n=1 Tax=Halocatena halophila TaxID=2814576 RepID=UPI002ED4B298
MVSIAMRDVTKRFGSVTALDSLDLTVQSGEIYGFLGPNGAGKSTAINVLLDFVRPTSGKATVLGYDTRKESTEIRARTGVLPDGYQLYGRLTGREHLEYSIASRGAGDDPDVILERVGIADAADRRAGGYSKGMAQRLALGMALVGEPELLLLDEPSTGLDPTGAREMRTIIEAEAARGATVFFSSHILGQVEAVCDRVGILRDGSLIAEDTIDGLKSSIDSRSTIEVTVENAPPGIEREIRPIGGVSSVEFSNSKLTIDTTDDAKMTVLQAIESTGATVKNVQTDDSSLEDLFVAYTSDESGVAQ